MFYESLTGNRLFVDEYHKIMVNNLESNFKNANFVQCDFDNDAISQNRILIRKDSLKK